MQTVRRRSEVLYRPPSVPTMLLYKLGRETVGPSVFQSAASTRNRAANPAHATRRLPPQRHRGARPSRYAAKLCSGETRLGNRVSRRSGGAAPYSREKIFRHRTECGRRLGPRFHSGNATASFCPRHSPQGRTQSGQVRSPATLYPELEFCYTALIETPMQCAYLKGLNLD